MQGPYNISIDFFAEHRRPIVAHFSGGQNDILIVLASAVRVISRI